MVFALPANILPMAPGTIFFGHPVVENFYLVALRTHTLLNQAFLPCSEIDLLIHLVMCASNPLRHALANHGCFPSNLLGKTRILPAWRRLHVRMEQSPDRGPEDEHGRIHITAFFPTL